MSAYISWAEGRGECGQATLAPDKCDGGSAGIRMDILCIKYIYKYIYLYIFTYIFMHITYTHV